MFMHCWFYVGQAYWVFTMCHWQLYIYSLLKHWNCFLIKETIITQIIHKCFHSWSSHGWDKQEVMEFVQFNTEGSDNDTWDASTHLLQKPSCQAFQIPSWTKTCRSKLKRQVKTHTMGHRFLHSHCRAISAEYKKSLYLSVVRLEGK